MRFAALLTPLSPRPALRMVLPNPRDIAISYDMKLESLELEASFSVAFERVALEPLAVYGWVACPTC